MLTSFRETLDSHQLELKREKATTLQVNVGFLCNLSCRHCHLHAGPSRRETMDTETMDAVVAYAKAHFFETIDITGGAPELHPFIEQIVQRLAPLTSRLLLRTNLTAFKQDQWKRFIAFCKEHHVILIGSFPSIHKDQTDAQRGSGVFPQVITSLQQLNAAGYGLEGSDLELNLVSNPVGAFLPGSQQQGEIRFRRVLAEKYGIAFSHLFQFANAPLGRFRQWLDQSGNLDAYLKKLFDQFNPGAVSSVMCRSLISIDWQGYAYDCDFNLSCGLYMKGRKAHVSEIGIPDRGSPIVTGDHCYACTAGSGFS
jgi:radical SAM/Cys-rich protein